MGSCVCDVTGICQSVLCSVAKKLQNWFLPRAWSPGRKNWTACSGSVPDWSHSPIRYCVYPYRYRPCGSQGTLFLTAQQREVMLNETVLSIPTRYAYEVLISRERLSWGPQLAVHWQSWLLCDQSEGVLLCCLKEHSLPSDTASLQPLPSILNTNTSWAMLPSPQWSSSSAFQFHDFTHGIRQSFLGPSTKMVRFYHWGLVACRIW